MGMVFYFIQTACVLTVLAYLLARTQFFSYNSENTRYAAIKNLLTIILFSFVALYGVIVQSTVDSVLHIDTRIAGIALAGFLFGRNISLAVFIPATVVTIILGEQTLLADVISMALACFLSSYINRNFNDNDAVLHGIIMGVLEIFHMLLIVCLVRPLEAAKAIVYSISFPMIVVNGLAVISFVLIINDINERRDLWEKESFTKSTFDIAARIQKSLLRTDFNLDYRLDLYAFLSPALDVGGDLYSFLLDDNRYFKFIIGDVSGKGVPASIVMSRTETLFSELALRYSDPAEIMTILNKRLCTNNKAMMFVTAFIGILDLTNGELKYANAGHVQPYIVEKGVETLEPERPKGKPLGIKANCEYETGISILKPGQLFISYTDGITEAENVYQELYGNEKLKAKLDLIEETGSKNVLEAVLTDVKSYTFGANQSDDICIFGFGIKEGFLHYEFKNEISAFLNSAKDLNNDLATYISNGKALDTKFKDDVALIVEELVSNIIYYGYTNNKEDIIKLYVYPEENKLVIMDNSAPYDPFTNESPNASKAPKEREIGGLGIFLTKNRIKSHSYVTNNGTNTLELVINEKEG